MSVDVSFVGICAYVPPNSYIEARLRCVLAGGVDEDVVVWLHERCLCLSMFGSLWLICVSLVLSAAVAICACFEKPRSVRLTFICGFGL